MIPQDSQYKQIQTHSGWGGVTPSTQATVEVHRLSFTKDKLTTPNYKTQVGAGVLV